jgi:hypothetical protein
MDPALQPSGLEGMPAAPARKPAPTVDARHPADQNPTAPRSLGRRAARGLPADGGPMSGQPPADRRRLLHDRIGGPFGELADEAANRRPGGYLDRTVKCPVVTEGATA